MRAKAAPQWGQDFGHLWSQAGDSPPFGLQGGPGVSEENFKVAQVVEHLVQQSTCSRGFLKAEIV